MYKIYLSILPCSDEVFHSEKIYQLNENMACSVAGITSDANVLTNELRLFGQRHYYRYREPMPCEQLVSMLCDLKQAYTQYGGKRPFGVSILYMGWDQHHGYQLYHSDPSGMKDRQKTASFNAIQIRIKYFFLIFRQL